MKAKLFFILIALCFLVSNIYSKSTKNILVFCFPGGKSHNFVFKEAFSHTLNRIKTQNKDYEIKFHVIIHNFDVDLWKDTEHNIIGYGDKATYEVKFRQGMEMAKEDPVMGYNNFNRAMIHLYEDFLKDGILDKLKESHFDMFISDIVNYLTIFLKHELRIKKSMYVNPTCIYTWFNEAFEYNPSYHPLIGTKFTEVMTFSERFINQIFLFGTRAMYKYYKYSQSAVFRRYGYDYEMDPIPKDVLYLNQCVDGVHFSVSLPPNIISTGPFLPKPSEEITQKNIVKFLDRFDSVVYVSQGTITKALRLDVLMEVFEHFSNIGFILSLKKEFIDSIKNVPKNVLLLDWVPQNDLLGHTKVKAFITHGGLNSILESLYHAKPLIVFGTSIDQVNGAVMVEYRKYGKAITSNSDITNENLIRLISLVMNDDSFKTNCVFASKLVKEKDGKETFHFWLNYSLEFGYEHLLIPAYSKLNFFQLYNVDVGLTYLFIFYIIWKLFFWVLKRIFRKCFGSTHIKDKSD
jgi:hypothetical protein